MARVCTDVHDGAYTVFQLTDGTTVKAKEVCPPTKAPYIVVDYGTPINIKDAITQWSNLTCVEGSVETS